MKKLRDMPQERFMKLFFGFITVCFLVGAVAMADRAEMFQGLWKILSSPAKVSTNYFYVGGYAATFLNMGLVALLATALYCVPGAVINPGSTLAFLLTLGFSSWGINVLNIWPTFLGVGLYCLVKKEKLTTHINTLLFSTGIAPLISELLVRYPGTEVGSSLVGAALALAVGLAIGFFLPAGLQFSPKVHKGFDLYSAALPIGMTAFFLQALLYKTPGVALPAAPGAETLQVASTEVVAVFCGVVFGLCVVLALCMGFGPKQYWKLLTDPAQVTNIQAAYGNAGFLMNVGIYGLFILGWYALVGASFNAVTFGIIFCMLACCNSGSHPANVWPIMAGYFLMSLVFGQVSQLAGGTFAGAINAQAICVGLCYANGLSPISDKYGWPYGLLAGSMHYVLVTSVPALHGGYCLYNGGFTAALICLILVPELERFGHTKEERKLLRQAKAQSK